MNDVIADVREYTNDGYKCGILTRLCELQLVKHLAPDVDVFTEETLTNTHYDIVWCINSDASLHELTSPVIIEATL